MLGSLPAPGNRAHVDGPGSQPIAELKSGLLCERAEHHFLGLRKAGCQKIKRATNEGECLPGPRTGN